MAENRPAEAAFENLIGKQPLTDEELAALLNAADYDDRLFAEADLVRRQVYGDTVFVRGLIEFTNYCKMTATIAVSGPETVMLTATG